MLLVRLNPCQTKQKEGLTSVPLVTWRWDWLGKGGKTPLQGKSLQSERAERPRVGNHRRAAKVPDMLQVTGSLNSISEIVAVKLSIGHVQRKESVLAKERWEDMVRGQ